MLNVSNSEDSLVCNNNNTKHKYVKGTAKVKQMPNPVKAVSYTHLDVYKRQILSQ